MFPNKDFERVAELLESHRWIYAKTMPENPHHYTLRKEWGNEEDFIFVVNYIRQHGYKAYFKGRAYIQLDLNGQFYWTMGAPIPQTILINRKDLSYESPYDAIAPVYDSLFSDSDSLEENEIIVRMLGDVSRKSILDIGCGTGFLLRYCSPRAYTGIDSSKVMLDRFRQASPKADLIYSRFESFANRKRYDLIVALFGSASYLSEAELSRISQLLTDGGKFFLMFYADGYYPVTYEKTGIEAKPLGAVSMIEGERIRYHNFEIVRSPSWE